MNEKKNRLRVRARAVPNAFEWGVADTGTEQVGVLVQILEGELQDQQLTWYGYFTDATEDRTLESLRTAGWDGSDILNLPGLGSTEFQLTLEEEHNEQYQTSYWKPAFINRIGVAMKNVMGPQEKAAFAARMRAKLGSAGAGPGTRPAPGSAAARSQPRQPARAAAGGGGGWDTSAPPPGDDDIPF